MILLLGSTGYVGTAFHRKLEELQIPHQALSRRTVNYTDRKTLVDTIRQTSATFLINAAGYTGKPNVDACEVHKAECLQGNAVFPGTIQAACDMAGIPWGHVSSGCIFTGRRTDGAPFAELDTPNFCFRTNNCSWYSGTKALGEECLTDSESTFIWRLRIPFNHEDSNRNYLSKLVRYERLLQAENSISHLGDFVSACIECWQKRTPFGLYNVTNSGSVTTSRVTELIQEHLLPDKHYSFFENEEEFMQIAAKTPRSNCVLSNQKLLATGIAMRTVDDAIIDSLKQWQTT